MKDWWDRERAQFMAKDGLRVDASSFIEFIKFLDPLVDAGGFGYEFEGLEKDVCHILWLYGTERKDMISVNDEISKIFGPQVEMLFGPPNGNYSE